MFCLFFSFAFINKEELVVFAGRIGGASQETANYFRKKWRYFVEEDLEKMKSDRPEECTSFAIRSLLL